MDGEEAAGEVAAMQFAAGRSVAQLAAEWERDAGWVEEAIRRALRESIPAREGGLKLTRTQARMARRNELGETAQARQGTLELNTRD